MFFFSFSVFYNAMTTFLWRIDPNITALYRVLSFLGKKNVIDSVYKLLIWFESLECDSLGSM